MFQKFQEHAFLKIEQTLAKSFFPLTAEKTEAAFILPPNPRPGIHRPKYPPGFQSPRKTE